MSYEFKDEIKGLIFNNPDQDLNKAFDMRDEINHVYAQAAKADKYEVKAKAFDRIKAYSDKAINGDITPLVLSEGVIDVVEQYDTNRLSESGEIE